MNSSPVLDSTWILDVRGKLAAVRSVLVYSSEEEVPPRYSDLAFPENGKWKVRGFCFAKIVDQVGFSLDPNLKGYEIQIIHRGKLRFRAVESEQILKILLDDEPRPRIIGGLPYLY